MPATLHRIVLATTAGLLLAPCPLSADEAATPETAPVETAPAAEQVAQSGPWIPPVTVTATRSPLEAFQYPGMVTVVGPEQLPLYQPSTPDDILRFVPGVEMTGGPRRNGEVPTIRGFSGADVIVLIDGTRQNFGSAHDGRLFVDPSLLKEVEVLRGPASSLYGSGGTGGVIELRTVDASDLLDPGEHFGITAGTGYQFGNDEWMARTTLFGQPDEYFEVLGSVVRRKSGSIDLGDGNSLENTSDDIVSGLVKGTLNPAPFHSVEASFQRFTNDAREPNNGQDPDAADVVDKDILADTFRLTYAYENPADDLLDLDITAYHTSFQVDERRRDDNGGGPAGEVLERDVDTAGLRIDNRSRLALGDSTDLTFTYGGEAYTDEQDGAADGAERDGVPDAQSDFLGTFVQAELAMDQPFGVLPGELLVIPGLRYDYYHSDSDIAAANSDDALSPRIGVSYMPVDWLMLFSNYAHAFRAPTFDEIYVTGVHFTIPLGAGITNSFVPNPDLKPQRTETIELGAGVDFEDVLGAGDRIQVKGTYFKIWGDDLIDTTVMQPTPFVDCNPFIPNACNGTTFLDNVPHATLQGKELEATYDSPRLRLSLGYSSIDGEDSDTNEKLGSLVPEQVTLDTGLKLPEIESIVGWRILAAARFDEVDDPAEERDGYVTHDLYFAWQPTDGPLDGLRIDLGVDNIFDRSYARAFTDATEAGRNIKGAVSYTLTW
jgi:hemoglobin/transferrin/lactoferrin receptor protein